MNLPLKEIKRIARGNLTGHYNIPIQMFIYSTTIIMFAELAFIGLQNPYATTMQTVILYIAEFLIALISSVFTIGQTRMHLSMARKQPYELKQLLYGFKNHTDKYLLYGLILTVANLLALLPINMGSSLLSLQMSISDGLLYVGLFILSLVLQIFFRLEFELLYLTALESENLSVIEVLKKSHYLMNGHRGRLFKLLISFFGYDILASLSMGIGYVWIQPYQMQTMANFYLDVLQQVPIQENYRFNQYV